MDKETKQIKEKRKKIQESIKGYRYPDFNKLVQGHEEYRSELVYAYNYANYRFDLSQLKKEVETWVNRKLNHIPDYEFVAVGQTAWLLNNGGFVEEDAHMRCMDKINKLSRKYEYLIEEKQSDVNKPNLVKRRTNDMIAELDGIVDDVWTGKEFVEPRVIIEKYGKIDLYTALYHFQKMEDGLEEVENQTDRKRLAIVLSSIIEILNETQLTKTQKKKTVRKARKKKIDPSKMVRKLNYLKDDKDNELTSIKPEKIIGAEVLWVFNVKTRKLGKYVAKDETGLSVKNSTILNYKEDESTSKTLRKPKDTLTILDTSGKVSQRKLLDNINAVETKLRGRIGKHDILVKVF